MRSTIVWLAVAGLALTCSGCSHKAPVAPPEPPPSPQPEPRLVWFTQIDAPDSIGSTDTLLVRLSGVAGPNGCYSFDHLEMQRTDSAIEITGHALLHKNFICPAIIVVFENVEQVVLPPFQVGAFQVVARQPDGSHMERTVTVGPG